MSEVSMLSNLHNIACSLSYVERLPDLVSIFDDAINVAVLRRRLDTVLEDDCARLAAEPGLNIKLVVDANQSGRDAIVSAVAGNEKSALADDIYRWVELVAEITGAESVGIRLMKHSQAMCPKLHVDNVSLRLVTTYQGPGTQFVSQHMVQRSKLGHASHGRSDEESGVLLPGDGIHTAQPGDVVLLKGEAWPNNGGHGAVHRSPPMGENETRVVLTLDPL